MTVVSPLSFSQIYLSVNKSYCKINVDIYIYRYFAFSLLPGKTTDTYLLSLCTLNTLFCSQIVLAILDHFSFMPISLLEQLLTS